MRTILVVEDDPGLRDTIELFLMRQGYRVVSTGDGLRAIELADRQPIDAALVDLLIPGQSGFQVTQTLKTRFGDRVRIVMMSGISSPAHREYALATGAERFLPKPFSVEELVQAVTAVCPLPTRADQGFRVARIGS